MSDQIVARIKACECGHDMSTHFREYLPGAVDNTRPYGACLALNCERCKAFKLAKELR
jgi:hypothetical protein